MKKFYILLGISLLISPFAEATSEVVERDKVVDEETRRGIISLTAQFYQLYKKREQEVRIERHERSLGALDRIESMRLDEAQKEEIERLKALHRRLRADPTFPTDFPIDIASLSKREQDLFLDGVLTDVPLEKMKGDLERYGVLPFRTLRHRRLLLGTGNKPTLAAKDVSLDHYLGEDQTKERIDSFPHTDTVDVSPAMNPTLVADATGLTIVDYIVNQGKKYDLIHHHGFGAQIPLGGIKKILEVGGTYMPGDFLVYVVSENSYKEMALDYGLNRSPYLAAPISLAEDPYNTMTRETAFSVTIDKIKEYFEKEGFDFVLGLVVEKSKQIEFYKDAGIFKSFRVINPRSSAYSLRNKG